jgi:hypothetical protein
MNESQNKSVTRVCLLAGLLDVTCRDSHSNKSVTSRAHFFLSQFSMYALANGTTLALAGIEAKIGTIMFA